MLDPFEEGPIGCPKTSLTYYQSTLHKIAESADLIYSMANA